ncbi:cell division protein FtsZ [Rhodoplanes sp. Z2-YC6860]|uniref:cell division protein FtsZ n=1 Tax=Rhodoplanes sp. Z2-YC6860 TaxID=674703 RepID=UPI00078DFC1A|nr:cell division protein FtsZ [Rhodoplanes sp. Z2-YC6860]AMN44246.1 cell division protein FtsZ [Rhodoplanes sp. Z2-YC6860]
MSINLKIPDIRELKPRLTVFGVGGAGGNAVNNMISAGLQGVDFVVANTDAQALASSKAERVIQMGVQVTEGLGAGSQPDVGRAAAEEVIDEIRDHLSGAHMVFVTAGMGGGTGTGAAPVVARVAKELGILTVGVVTKPFHFEGGRRMRFAEAGILELQKCVDTQIIIPNQNLFRVANEKTTFADAFAMADQVLYSGVACITDLMVKEGLINLDFADVRAVMREMGKAMMGTGEASGEKRALRAAEAAIANPLIDDVSMKGARGLLISITGGKDLTLYEVDEAATRIREEVDQEANIIVGATFDEGLEGIIRVSVVATGIDTIVQAQRPPGETRLAELTQRLRSDTQRLAERVHHEQQQAPQPQLRAPAAQPAPVAAAPQPAPRPAFEHGATAAVAAALQPAPVMEDVTVRPIAPTKPSLFVEPVMAEPAPQEMPKAFIPPEPERAARAPRMPRLEDLPLPAQNQLRARHADPADAGPEKQRLSLLQRLAQVGLGRRDDAEAPAGAAAPEPVRQAMPPLPVRQPPRMPDPVSEYAKRPQPAPTAPQGLDMHGRPSLPVQKPVDDDQLEIPAFLRRQAN